MQKRCIYFFLLVSIAVLFHSCRKDSSASWDVDVQIPLIKTSLTIEDLIADSLLQVESDNTVTLVYKNPIYTFQLDTLLDVPDTISHKYYPGLPGAQITAGQDIYNQTEQETFDFNGAEVSRLDLSKGFIAVEFINTLNEEVLITYKILSATKNGQYFQITKTIPAANGTPYHYKERFDISGYSLDMRGQNLLSSNHIVTSSKAQLSATANTVTLTAQDQFDMLVTFEEVGISYARGYFAQHQYSFGPSNSPVKLFNSIHGGTIALESIKMSLYFENNFGVDVRVKFKEITAINTKSGHEVTLNSPVIGQTINISRALETYNPSQPVTPSFYSFDLNSSNVLDMVENLPDQMRYSIDVESNPLGNISSGNDFVYGGKNLTAYLDMEIPLSLMASNLNLGDTMAFSLGEVDDSRQINSGELTLLADNGFPFNAEVMLIALDAEGNVIDVIIDHQLIQDAPLNSDGFAPDAVRSVINIPLSRERIELLYMASQLYIAAYFNTTNAGSQYVHIYDSYRLDMKVTGKFNYVVE